VFFIEQSFVFLFLELCSNSGAVVGKIHATLESLKQAIHVDNEEDEGKFENELGEPRFADQEFDNSQEKRRQEGDKSIIEIRAKCTQFLDDEIQTPQGGQRSRGESVNDQVQQQYNNNFNYISQVTCAFLLC